MTTVAISSTPSLPQSLIKLRFTLQTITLYSIMHFTLKASQSSFPCLVMLQRSYRSPPSAKTTPSTTHMDSSLRQEAPTMPSQPTTSQEKSLTIVSIDQQEEKHQASITSPMKSTKCSPMTFNDMLFLFFQQCYIEKNIPNYWKHCKIILLHKIDNPLLLSNY